MLRAISVVTLALAASGVAAPSSGSPSIKTTSGTYNGGLNATANVEFFKGVRYGQPPLGNLRFAAPVAVTPPPSGALDATNFGNACPQLPLSEAFTILYGSPSLAADVNEDCLFLNIYRPEGTEAGDKLPILTFIHGGAYSVGGTWTLIYESSNHGTFSVAGSQFDGTNMVHRSVSNGAPIIFVTINYRLYVTGFLSSTHVPAEDLNAGLLDQRLALQFLQKNAAAFGGDPEKVTIWGQSAGASSVALHYLYPTSESLFRAGIEHSGTGTILHVPTVDEYDLPNGPFTNLLKLTGCNTASAPLDCLRGVPLDSLLNAAASVDTLTPQAAPGQSTTWLPSLGPEGSLITEFPSAVTVKGDYKRVPLISGTNLDEGTLFVISFLGLNQTPAQDTETFDGFVLNRTLVPSDVKQSTVDEFEALYPALPPSPTSNSSLFDRMSLFANDFHFLAPQRFLQANVDSKQNIWAYLFGETIPGLPAELGAFHGAELTYLGILNRTVPGTDAFSAQFMDFYLNFTVHADPGAAWPRFTPAHPRLLQLRAGNVTLVPDDVRVPQTGFVNSPEVTREMGR